MSQAWWRYRKAMRLVKEAQRRGDWYAVAQHEREALACLIDDMRGRADGRQMALHT